MASVKLLLRKDKVSNSGEYPLYIRITHNRKSRYISLKESLPIEQWDEKNAKVKKNHPYSSRLNKFISQKIAEANEIAFKMESEPEQLRKNEIEEVLKGQEPIDFFQFFEKHLQVKQQNGKIGAYRKGKSVLKKLKNYWPRKRLRFTEITVSFLKAYEQHLVTEYDNAPNTIYSDMKVIRRIFSEALEEDLIGDASDPFRKYKLKWTKTQKEYLSEEELKRIEELELPEGNNIYHHRNMFIFSAYVGGLRISDILQLRWKNFDDTHITIKIHKTKETLSIKVPSKGKEILSGYKLEDNEPNDFIFPMIKLSPEEEDPEVIYQAISSATAYTNKHLKEIATRTEIPHKLSFHTARHTWATRALRLGMRIEYVSKLMGHANIKTTQVYAKIVNSELDKAMDEAFD